MYACTVCLFLIVIDILVVDDMFGNTRLNIPTGWIKREERLFRIHVSIVPPLLRRREGRGGTFRESYVYINKNRENFFPSLQMLYYLMEICTQFLARFLLLSNRFNYTNFFVVCLALNSFSLRRFGFADYYANINFDIRTRRAKVYFPSYFASPKFLS